MEVPLRIDVCCFYGAFGTSNHTLTGLRKHRETSRLDRMLVAPIGAASASVGGEDRQEPDANTDVLQLHRLEPQCEAWYWARPTAADHDIHALAGALQSEAFRGVFLAPEMNDFALDDRHLNPLLEVCARVDTPVMVWVGERADARPTRLLTWMNGLTARVTWILHGGAKPNLRRETAEVARRIAARRDGRVYVTTAGGDLAGIQLFVEKLGAKRILLGTGGGGEYAEDVLRPATQLRELRAGLSDESFAAICGENASGLFANWLFDGGKTAGKSAVAVQAQ